MATSSCASARKDGENEPNQINGCVPMKEKCQWSAVIDNIIPASGRPQKHTGEHVSRRKRTAEAVRSLDIIASAQSRWGRDNKPTYTPQLLRMRKI